VAGSTKRLRDSVSLPSSLSLTHSHEGTCYLTHSHLLPCSLPLQGAEESKRSPGSPGPLRRHSSLGNLPAWWTLHSPAPTASATRPSTRSHSVLRKGTFRMDSCCVTYRSRANCLSHASMFCRSSLPLPVPRSLRWKLLGLGGVSS
jgi:hypothetical protein